MEKNRFAILKHDSEDEEVNEKDNKSKPEEKKLNKKEMREQDKNQREALGDHVQKDTKEYVKKNYKRNKEDEYKTGSDRVYERKSGTGFPAHTNEPKKGGHGKGNVGVPEQEQQEIEKIEEEVKKEGDAQQQPPEKTGADLEEVITLDKYLEDKKINYGFMDKKEEEKLETKKEHEASTKIELNLGNPVRRESKKKPAKKERIEMNEEQFPSLN